MAVTVVLPLSIALQFLAAALALRLIRASGGWRVWALIAAAVLPMAIRRCITFFQLLSGDMAHPPDLPAEAPAISVLMVNGLASIAPLFLSLRRSQAALVSEARRWHETFCAMQGLAESYDQGASSHVREPVEFDESREAVYQLTLYWMLLNVPPSSKRR